MKIRIGKAKAALNKLDAIWKFDPADNRKLSLFDELVLMFGAIAWSLSKIIRI